ncbi:hypothetical protein PoB_004471500 [Plakobranchus ocellatus]|uniref:Uncharacterized protein n=1 Tax=Plakobranchus ocellatus TaxID=259542 RepID=A0AAV4BGI3_9GAST|nr:hypothetical protein PoB_004471500 [Plakobranchus ocellatus]
MSADKMAKDNTINLEDMMNAEKVPTENTTISKDMNASKVATESDTISEDRCKQQGIGKYHKLRGYDECRQGGNGQYHNLRGLQCRQDGNSRYRQGGN